MVGTWDTLLHDDTEAYPTHKSRDRLPSEGSVVYVHKIGEPQRVQAIRSGNVIYNWDPRRPAEVGDQVICNVGDDYVWRGCGGFDF